MLSGTWTLKHEIGSPLCVPIFAHTGDEKEIHPLTIISLKASFNSGLYSLFAAASVILSIAPSNVSPFSKYPLLSICSDSSLNHQMFVFSSIIFSLLYKYSFILKFSQMLSWHCLGNTLLLGIYSLLFL